MGVDVDMVLMVVEASGLEEEEDVQYTFARFLAHMTLNEELP